MKRLLADNNWKIIAKTSNDTLFEDRCEVPIISGELPVMLEMPGGSEGKTVPTNAVLMALLWQQYGLDLPHPEVSRWLERYAPDVKYAVAKNKSMGSNGDDPAELKVSSDGTIKVHLSLEVDQRLREVSSQYIRWQSREPIERRDDQDDREEQNEDFRPSPLGAPLGF
jgi:hypothetical protein